jgi:hypothetical protein
MAPLHTLDYDKELEFDEDIANIFIPDLVAGSRDTKEFKAMLNALHKVSSHL